MMQDSPRKPHKKAQPKDPTIPTQRPKPPLPNASEFVQIGYLQRLILFRAGQEECPETGLARLAIAFCALGERKRILRGLPLPGQLRPDLDPLQLAKALKRHRARGTILDVQESHRATFTDEPETKESLQIGKGGDGVGGGEGQGKAGA